MSITLSQASIDVIVQTLSGLTGTIDKAIAHCAAALARFKVPRTVVVVADLPRVNFGKVAKTRLREMAHAQFSKGDTT